MNHLKIGTRLGIGFGIMVVMITLMAGFGLYQLAQVQEQMNHVAKSNFVKLNYTFDALGSIQDIARAANQIAMSEDPALQKAEREKIDTIRARYRESIKKLEDLETSVDPDTLPTHLTCAFGKWVQETGKERCSHASGLREIDVPHAKVHEQGRLAVQAFNSGDRVRAESHCREMTECSQKLIEILGELERDCANC
jgi:methyl-accepting chemotaxis protein